MEKHEVDGLILTRASEFPVGWTLVESGTGRVHRALGAEHATVPGLYRTPLECNRGDILPVVSTLERLPSEARLRLRLCRACRLTLDIVALFHPASQPQSDPVPVITVDGRSVEFF